MVQRALPTRPARQSEGILPEAIEVLCAQCSEASTTQATEEEVSCQNVIKVEAAII